MRIYRHLPSRFPVTVQKQNSTLCLFSFLFSVLPETQPGGFENDTSYSSDSLHPNCSLQTGGCYWGKDNEELPVFVPFVCFEVWKTELNGL